ncbi:MAG: hypothetical protein PHW79_03030 [Candidatus Marinimicrobia bacterium]|nr:hypothetical protein [Candidatus Neomarinimicrobiota bacterium]
MKNLMRTSVFLLVVFGFATTIFAASPVKSTQVTVYNDNLGLVLQTRSIDITKGESEVRVEGIPACVDPTSVRITFPGKADAIEVLEQNFLFDLVNSDKIFEKYIGESITYKTKSGEQTAGKLLQYDGGNLVLQVQNGGIKIASTENIADYDFPSLPSGLILKPTLQWLLSSKIGAQVESEISYLTSGMSWHAEYLMVLEKNDRDFTLNSWVSLDNQSGATYENARMKLVAGNINRIKSAALSSRSKNSFEGQAVTVSAPFDERGLFDYHLYELQRPVTIKDREIKQIAMFDEVMASAKKFYLFKNSAQSEIESPLEVHLKLVNSADNHLGIPLPEGVFRIFKKDVDNTLQLVGEDRIKHTAKDDTLDLTVGKAFDVKGKKIVVDRQKIGEQSEVVSVKIEITNKRTEQIEVEIFEFHNNNWFVKKSSHSYQKKSNLWLVFPVIVPAEKTVTVNYTFQRSW